MKDKKIKEETEEEKIEISSMDDTIAKLEQKANEYLDTAKRIQAEFDNYRKRNVLEVKAAKESGIIEVITTILSIKDTIELALKMITDNSAKEGIMLINKQIDSTLSKYEVTEIEAHNQEFNPDYHNAILRVEDSENQGKVIEVLQKGYCIGKKVLRYSVVKVAV